MFLEHSTLLPRFRHSPDKRARHSRFQKTRSAEPRPLQRPPPGGTRYSTRPTLPYWERGTSTAILLTSLLAHAGGFSGSSYLMLTHHSGFESFSKVFSFQDLEPRKLWFLRNYVTCGPTYSKAKNSHFLAELAERWRILTNYRHHRKKAYHRRQNTFRLR